MKLLVTSYDALLLVTMRANGGGPRRIDVVASDHGIYFGASRAGRITYVVARNLTADRTVRDPSTGTNAIEEWDIERGVLRQRWTHPALFDLHQIRVRGSHLFVLSGRAPCLLIFDRSTRTLVRTLDLNSCVPAHLRREAPDQHPSDRYHFNSITFTPDGRMLILAHNWGSGSFALEFDAPPFAVLTGGWKLRQVHEGLGFEAHDILCDGADQFVINSRRNSLMRSGVPLVDFAVPGFPRGLAATKRHLYVTSGLASPGREQRSQTRTQLNVIDRRSGAVVKRIGLGQFGNSCDVTLLDADDLTDFDPLARRRGWRRGLDRAAAWLIRRSRLPALGIGTVAAAPTVAADPAPKPPADPVVARPSGVSYEIRLASDIVARQGKTLTLKGTITNTGPALPAVWGDRHALQLGAEIRVGDRRARVAASRFAIGPDGIAAGATVPFSIDIHTGGVSPGPCTVLLDLLYEQLVWLGKIGGSPLEVAVEFAPAFTFESVDEDCPVGDVRFWQQHVPAFNPSSRMNIRSPSFQDYEIRTSRGTIAARSMLTQYELALLYSLAKYHWQGRGHIVDLGPLLGLGTYAMADGLAQNKTPRGDWRIYSYDLFLMEFMDHFLPAGDSGETGSVFNRFLEINRDFLDVVVPVPGDILKMNWTGKPIEILFVDLAKSWPLNRHVVSNFFPYLIPGHSIVIQQDYVHAGEPWVAATMELFDEYFERLYFVYGASAVYRLLKPIPADLLARDLQKNPEADPLFERARTKVSPAIAEVLKCCQAMLRAERGDIAGAQAILESVNPATRDGVDPSQEFGPAIPASLRAARLAVEAARLRFS